MGTSETSDGEAITNSKLENKNILHTEVLEEAVQLGQLHAGAGAREAGHFNHIANNVNINSNDSDLSSEIKRILQLHSPPDEADDASSYLQVQHNERHNHNVDALLTGLASPTQNVSQYFQPSPVLNQTKSPKTESRDSQEPTRLEAIDDFINDSWVSPSPLSAYNEEKRFNSTLQTPSWGPESPSIYLISKCALWDCSRPSEEDYCCKFHENLALSEGAPNRPPVMRPGGISVIDHLLFEALENKTEGKEVGIPTCDSAATSCIPWEAPALFNVKWTPEETLRDWLFFSEPQHFGSTSRKQRTLPGYSGRGWHESRKNFFSTPNGVKRMLYLDPQPPGDTEWHLYEYELEICKNLALHRLEMKKKGKSPQSGGKSSSRRSSGVNKEPKAIVKEQEDLYLFKIGELELQ